MKKIILILMLFVFIFSACSLKKVDNIGETSKNDTNIITKDKEKQDESKEIVNNEKENQKYSFGPMADLARIDDKTKMKLQEVLNKLGDPPKDKITFSPMGAYYQEDGSVVIDVFVRNGCSDSIFNIDAELKLIEDEQNIASAHFGFGKEEFGVLSPNESRPWTIIYYPQYVKNKNAKLENLIIKSEYQYEY